jgi:hypothetical protein
MELSKACRSSGLKRHESIRGVDELDFAEELQTVVKPLTGFGVRMKPLGTFLPCMTLVAGR